MPSHIKMNLNLLIFFSKKSVIKYNLSPRPATSFFFPSQCPNTSFTINIKTIVYIGTFLVSGIFYYFTFMNELDNRFAELEGSDKDLMVEIDKRLTELENKFTPIGEGVYSVDPKTTWPPSRNEYKMKDVMQVNQIKVLEDEIEELKEELKELREKVYEK